MGRKKARVVGIDLAGAPTRPTGICFLRGSEVIESRDVYDDASILRFVAGHEPEIIAIDAPLCLPPGRKWSPGKAFPSNNGSHFRKCDLELRARGIRFFPITLGPMRSLTMRGIALRRSLEKSGYRVIEIYPGGAQDVWGIARKQKGLALLRRGLKKLGVLGVHSRMSGDELDAVSGALVGSLFLDGRAEVYGDFKSGAIVMPAERSERSVTTGLSTHRISLVRFAPMTTADLPDLESMVLALYREDPTGQRMTVRKIRRTVAELRSHPDKGCITVARVGREIAGYAVVIYFWSNEYGGNIAHIDELYVRPQWRSRGIGARFLERVVRTKGKAFRGVRLEVTPSNQRAFAFYSRHGFRPAKNRHMFRKLD